MWARVPEVSQEKKRATLRGARAVRASAAAKKKAKIQRPATEEAR